MKKSKLKIKYIQMEPKNETETKESERKLDRAFGILFDEVNKKRRLVKSLPNGNDTCST